MKEVNYYNQLTYFDTQHTLRKNWEVDYKAFHCALFPSKSLGFGLSGIMHWHSRGPGSKHVSHTYLMGTTLAPALSRYFT